MHVGCHRVSGKWFAFASGVADFDHLDEHVFEHDWVRALPPVPVADQPCSIGQASPFVGQRLAERWCFVSSSHSVALLEA